MKYYLQGYLKHKCSIVLNNLIIVKMEYKGKLYGKLGHKYFDTSKTSEDWDKMENEINFLKRQSRNSLKELFKELYNSEINLQFDWQWDGGFRCLFGDGMNGFEEPLFCENIDEMYNLIIHKALLLYPKSDFAIKYLSV